MRATHSEFKAGYACQYRFESVENAPQVIRQWIKWYDGERPHQAPRHMTPNRKREKLTVAAA
ncbi:MAG: transposase [Planctomycetes bacterium]|nr:transposase [Planctomycetota bacterium]